MLGAVHGARRFAAAIAGVIFAFSVVFLDDIIYLLPTHDPDFVENRSN